MEPASPPAAPILTSPNRTPRAVTDGTPTSRITTRPSSTSSSPSPLPVLTFPAIGNEPGSIEKKLDDANSTTPRSSLIPAAPLPSTPESVIGGHYHTPTPLSPLFPSPSSSFRPTPENNDDRIGIDERLAKGKGRRNLSVDLVSTTPRHTSDEFPMSPPPISRPPSVSLSRTSSTHLTRKNRSGSVASSKLSSAVSSPRIDLDVIDSPWSPASSHSSRLQSSLSIVVNTPPLLPHASRSSSSSFTPISTASPSITPVPSNVIDSRVIVRDFAFERHDPRWEGLPHPDALKKRESYTSELGRSGKSGDDLIGGSASPGGGGGGGGSSIFSWGFVTSHQTDFPVESDGSQAYSNEGDDDDVDAEYEEEEDSAEFIPGLYETLFDFEPELDTEMRIKVGEVVTVFARKCAGWVQAGRIIEGEGEAEIGLVPENYLALLERDEALWQSEGEGEGEGDVEEIEVDEGVETGAIGLEKVDVIPESQLESPLNTTTLAIKEAPA